MEIVDKYSYLEEVIAYIEKNIINSKGWPSVLRKIKISKDLLAELSSGIQKFSENAFFAILEEKLEKRHSSITGAEAYVYGVDLKIDTEKVRAKGPEKAFILLTLNFKIIQKEDTEDKITMIIRIYSKENIKVSFLAKEKIAKK